jgi:hypothetical protein
MTALARLLADPAALSKRIEVSAPEPIALRRAAARIDGVIGRSMQEIDLEDIRARIVVAARENAQDVLSRRDLREGCRSYLQPPDPPGRDAAVGDWLIGEVDRLRRRAAFFALIDAYLDQFAPNDDDIARLGKRLSALCKGWPWRPTDPWPERIRAFNLFDSIQAPARLAAAIFKSDDEPRDVMVRAGLVTEGRRKGGLAQSAFSAGCRLVAEKRGASATSLQHKIIAWARSEALALAYPAAWPNFAAALFDPWSDQEPENAEKTLLIEAATKYGGDPRINAARWRPIENTGAYEVIVRWLTKASVEQFFDIVAQTTDRPDMWAERRKFWTRYLKADMISAAWVAFGADGAWRAEEAAKRSSDAGLSMFGRLGSGGGRTAEHAALIMRIGDLTVVEWSHNGRWNIWRRQDKGHPELFRHNNKRWPDYQPQELMNGALWGPHMGAWQFKVREIVAHETGLRP